MDSQNNASVSGCLQAGCQLEPAPSPVASMLGEFITGESMEGGEDVSLEWLSIYVEDCLSGTTSYTTSQFIQPPATTTHPQHQTTSQSFKPPQPQSPKPSFQDLAVPAKARSKRRRVTPRAFSHGSFGTFHVTPSDPLLLHQTYWLADSELIFPKKEKEEEEEGEEQATELAKGEGDKVGKDGSQGPQPRRCTHCLSHKTPQWRAGPLGPKTLCNACGVRFKSGRLLPEYRPAKSPTFVNYKHSNSHKKVMEMRMAIMSPPST